MEHIERDETEEGVWHFKTILAHKGPLTKNSKEYKGSKWNVQLLWETGETSWEPLSVIKDTDPVTCAIYAKEHDLLETEGWKSLRKLAKKQKTLL